MELKGGTIHRAVEQLTHTYDAWKRRAVGLECAAEVELAVVMSGSAPTDQKRIKSNFQKQTGKVLRLLSGRRNCTIPAEAILRRS